MVIYDGEVKYEAERTMNDMDEMILVGDKDIECTAAMFFLAGGQICSFIPKPRVKYLGILLNRHRAYISVERLQYLPHVEFTATGFRALTVA